MMMMMMRHFVGAGLVAGAAAAGAAPLCPPDMPADWLPACRGADLFYQSPAAPPADNDDVLHPMLGNGFLGTFAFSDTVFAAGVFDGDATGVAPGGRVSHRATIPSYLVAPHGGAGAATRGSALDVRRAVFLRRATSTPAATPSASPGCRIDERLFAPLDRPNLLVHEVELSGPSCQHATFSGTLSTPSADDLRWTRNTSTADGVLERVGTNRHAELNGSSLTTVSVLTTEAAAPIVHRRRDDGGGTTTTAGTTLLTFLTVVVTSLNSTEPLADARAVYADAAAAAATLFPNHVSAWAERHAQGALTVEWAAGDDRGLGLAAALNASLYAVRASTRPDWAYGLSPGGLASNAYNGHTFWDQETWMWPPLLMLDPPCARAGLQYRWDRRDQAHAKAAACGTPNHASSGAPDRGPLPDLPAGALMFPWESAVTGTEVQFGGGSIGPWGQYEQHISGDVVLAARQFWYTTGDAAWLKEIGYPLARGVADFYARRVVAASTTPDSNSSGSRNDSGAMFSFNAVMGPDEYNWPVNNSAYTNAIARIALEFAVEAAMQVTGTAGDPLWATVAAGLPVPLSPTVPGFPDLKGGFHPEYDGFVPRATAKRPHPVKQADTIMLSFPMGLALRDPAHEAAFANDLAVYDPLTDPAGPAMTWSVFAIGWMNVHNYSRASALFQRGYVNNVNPPFNVWSEVPHGRGTINFITGAGGFLQSALFGALGMRIKAPCALAFDPPPPSVVGVASVTAMRAESLHLCGWRVAQRVTAGTMAFRVVEVAAAAAAGGAGALELGLANGTVVRLREAGDAAVVPRGAASLLARTGRGRVEDAASYSTR